jgi:hypothetical protein
VAQGIIGRQPFAYRPIRYPGKDANSGTGEMVAIF